MINGSDSGAGVVILASVLVGVVVAWRQPGQPMGWLLLGVALFFAIMADAGPYSVLDYRMHHGSLPLGAVAVVLQPSWAPVLALLGLTILLFPDGRLPSRGWRWALRLYLAVSAFWVAGVLVVAISAIVSHNVHVDSGGNLLVVDHPTGAYAWWSVAQSLFFIVLALIGPSFKHALLLILTFAAVMSFVAAVASALRGAKYVYEDAESLGQKAALDSAASEAAFPASRSAEGSPRRAG